MKLFIPYVNEKIFEREIFEIFDKEGNWNCYGHTINTLLKKQSEPTYFTRFMALCQKNQVTFRGFRIEQPEGSTKYKVVIYSNGYDSFHWELENKNTDITKGLAGKMLELLTIQLKNKEVIEQVKKGTL